MAGSVFTRVGGRACIAVGAGHFDRDVNAPVLGIAAVLRACIAIVARQHSDAGTISLNASVGYRARISIVTVRANGHEEAISILACFCRAWIRIIAQDGRPSCTRTVDACIARCARVTVAAATHRGAVLAAAIGQTVVYRTSVSIVAFEAAHSMAFSLLASVTDRAGIVVIAGSRVR